MCKRWVDIHAMSRQPLCYPILPLKTGLWEPPSVMGGGGGNVFVAPSINLQNKEGQLPTGSARVRQRAGVQCLPSECISGLALSHAATPSSHSTSGFHICSMPRGVSTCPWTRQPSHATESVAFRKSRAGQLQSHKAGDKRARRWLESGPGRALATQVLPGDWTWLVRKSWLPAAAFSLSFRAQGEMDHRQKRVHSAL